MGVSTTSLDRRATRRSQTIEEALDIALEVIAEEGVAGLSAGEVARRMGIKPPSLYVYFPSKHALYDALFERGARAFRDAATGEIPESGTLHEALTLVGEAAVRWAVENPSYSQLLFWRPVPRFEPSASAFAPAQEAVARGVEDFRALQKRGELRPDVSAEDALRDWTILISGVISQQLANEPDAPLERGIFTTRLPAMVDMFVAHYGAPSPKRKTTRKRGSHDRTR